MIYGDFRVGYFVRENMLYYENIYLFTYGNDSDRLCEMRLENLLKYVLV